MTNRMNWMNWMNLTRKKTIRFLTNSKNGFLTYVLLVHYFSHYLTFLRPFNGGRDGRASRDRDHLHIRRHIHQTLPRIHQRDQTQQT